MRKRRIQIAALLLIALASANFASAGPGGCMDAPFLVGFADEALTVSSTSKALTAATYAPDGLPPADMAVCNVETDAIRYRVSGGTPTAAVGQYIQAGSATAASTFMVCGLLNLKKFRAIRVTNDAALYCTYYRIGDN